MKDLKLGVPSLSPFQPLMWLSLVLLGVVFACQTGLSQQVVQRGALGKPDQVLDQTGEWTAPILVASDADVEMYIPDVSSPAWLKRNYPDFHDRGFYTLTLFTFYKNPKACRQNRIAWGLGDKASLDACIETGYRLREGKVDPHEKSATLLKAAMIDQAGKLDPASVQNEETFRYWNQLDPNTQSALEKANVLIEKQLAIYDRKMQGLR